jgi:hypothetical protein
LDIQAENGKPLSLLNAQSSLLAVAKAVILPEKTRMRRTTRRNVARASEPVFLNKTRYGASASSARSSGPIQKSIVRSIAKPITTFKTKDHHIARGTLRDASSTSSAI